MEPRHRIAGLSIPKSGTHLLAGIFKAMGYTVIAHPKAQDRQILEGLSLPDVPRSYVYGHWRYSPEADARLTEAGFHKLVLIRDPRDICLSMADFIKSGRAPGVMEKAPALTSLPLKTLRLMVIEGIRLANFRTPGIGRICQGWLQWSEHGAVLLKYEDVGEAAMLGRNIESMQSLEVDPEAFRIASKRRFKPKASRYRWETEFDDELHAAWMRQARGVAASLGYQES